MKIRAFPVITTALIALTACGGDPADSGAVVTPAETSESVGVAAASAVVTISNSRFDNVELRVEPGTTVTFVNTDPFAHTITSVDESPVEFDSGDLGQDQVFEFTFDEPGEYAYFCRIHPTMRAVVIVG